MPIPRRSVWLLLGFAKLWAGAQMLTKMDQNTIAKMTAALEYVCKKIPPDKESNELRKRIGDAIAECANSGNGSLSDFQKLGSKVLGETMRPPKANWLGLGRLSKSRTQRRSLASHHISGGLSGAAPRDLNLGIFHHAC